MSPTARTLEFLRRNGYLCGVVERTLPRCFIKVDLFGWCDIVAVPEKRTEGVVGDPDMDYAQPAGTVYVQTTSHSNHFGRRRKIIDSPAARTVLAAGNAIWLVSWRQKDGRGTRWTATVEEITLATLATPRRPDRRRAAAPAAEDD